MLPARHSRRPGFTLVELLIVVAIISILLALGASATVRVIDVQRGNNTEQTVKIVSDHLDRAWVAVIEQAKTDRRMEDYLDPQNPNGLLQRAGGNRDIARIIWIKLSLRREFPMTFDEARNPITLLSIPIPPNPVYRAALHGAIPSSRTSESSVCLLLALQQARSGMTFDADRLGSGAVGPGYVSGPAAAQSLQQIVDGFANGLAFFRWPAQNRELNPDPQGQAGHVDPCDPKGLLTSHDWLLTTPGATPTAQARWFFRNIHRIPIPQNRQDLARSYKLLPVVASAGRNGQLGLGGLSLNDFAEMLVNNPEEANDNVYSYRLRFGARGD